jgi:hypothetical protein
MADNFYKMNIYSSSKGTPGFTWKKQLKGSISAIFNQKTFGRAGVNRIDMNLYPLPKTRRE